MTVRVRLADAYQWLLVPCQPDPSGPVYWEPVQFDGARQALADERCPKAGEQRLPVRHLRSGTVRQRLDNELSAFLGRRPGTSQHTVGTVRPVPVPASAS